LAGLNGSTKAAVVRDLSPLPKLSLDRGQIEKVLLNLFLNANEAVAQNGEIRVVTCKTDHGAVLSVTDNGCGISKEFISRSLFQPFQTTKSEGLGIGLFHSKKIIEAHRGKIEVESEEGRGTTFRIIFPVSESNDAKSKT
jgi:signal transduction histidine kinase